MPESLVAGQKIAVLLEIENDNHTPDRCFDGLPACCTLSVPAVEVRDADPDATARRIYDRFLAHRQRFAAGGHETVAIATHVWQEWRDTIGAEVQAPFAALVRQGGVQYVELPTEGCNAEFRRFVQREVAPLNA
jgi:hypothetical protein